MSLCPAQLLSSDYIGEVSSQKFKDVSMDHQPILLQAKIKTEIIEEDDDNKIAFFSVLNETAGKPELYPVNRTTRSDVKNSVSGYLDRKTHEDTIVAVKSSDAELFTDESRRFVCSSCSRSYKSKAALCGHLARVHPQLKPHVCTSCGKAFRLLRDLCRHRRERTGELLKCKFPAGTFPATRCKRTSQQSMVNEAAKQPRHKPKIVFQAGASHPSIIGSESFAGKQNRKLRLQFNCEIEVEQSNEDPIWTVEIECDVDHRWHAGKKLLPATSAGNTHAPTARSVSLTCETCGKTFAHVGNLKRHMLLHTGEKQYQCKVCRRCFTQKCSLIAHERVHTGEKPFACTHCRKRFSQLANLNSHTRAVHDKAKQFVCDRCGVTFAHACSLAAHVRTHTGERPYRCKVCEKSYIHLISLTDHLARHSDHVIS